MRPRIAAALFGCLLGCSMEALAQSGQITGAVTDGAAPVAGLPVQLELWFGGYVAGTVTGAGGEYAFAGLADGDYLVKALSDPARDVVGEYYRDANEFDRDLATPIHVAGAATVAGVDFVVGAGGTISGALAGLSPGQSVNIQVYDADTRRFRGNVGSDPVTLSYTVPNLPAGRYRVYVNPVGTDRAFQWYGNRTRFAQADVLTLGADEDRAGVDFALVEGSAISGTVTLPAGGSPSTVSVEARDPFTDEWLGSAGPDAATGAYTIANLPPAAYAAYVNAFSTGYLSEYWSDTLADARTLSQATPIVVAAGAPAAGIDLALDLGRRISGHVFLDLDGSGVQDGGEPDLAGASVHAELSGTCCAGNGAQTDASGNYSIVGLAAGAYQVTVEHGEGPGGEPFVARRWNGRTVFEAGDPVAVGAADVSGIDFAMPTARTISGTVFFDLDGDGARDAGEGPVVGASVRFWRGGACCDHATTDAAGGYRIAADPGSYVVEAFTWTGSLVREYWQNVHFQELATPVAVSTGAGASGIDFSLIDASLIGTLRGQVLQPGGVDPIPGLTVRVQSYSSGSEVTSVQTDAAGRFSLGNLAPGEYKVLFDTGSSNAARDEDFVAEYWNRCQDEACPPGVIDPLQFKVTYPASPAPPGGPGADLGTFELTIGGAVAGTVCVGGTGAPCTPGPLPAAVWVNAQGFVSGGPFRPSPGSVQASLADGSFRLRGLPAPAAYRLQTWAGGTDFVSVYYVTAAQSSFSFNLASPVQVDVGASVTGIDLHLFTGGSISGHVTCDAGTDVPFAPVWVDLVNQPGIGFGSGATADAAGRYRVRGLPAGEYGVRTNFRGQVTPCGVLANEEQPALVTVVEGADTPGIDFDLEEGGSIQGTVTQTVDATTLPVVNLRVSAVDFDSGDYVSDGYTDASGAYVIGSLVTGRRYRVTAETRDNADDPQFFNFIREYWDDARSFDEADPVNVPSPAPLTGIDFHLELGGGISGQVTDQATGQPLPGVRVNANPVGGCCGNGDTTDQNGFYIIRGLPPGPYQVYASPAPLNYVAECYDDATDCAAATPVAVAAVPPGGPVPVTTGIDFALEPGRVIRGRVTRAADGAPVANLRVVASQSSSPWGYGEDTTDAAGEYEIGGLLPGAYDLQPRTIGTDLAFQRRLVDVSSGDRACLDTGGRTDCEDFSLAAGATLRVNAFEDLDGDLVPDAGEGRAGVDVSLYDFATGQSLGGGSWVGTTDASGRLDVTGLAAGSYRVATGSGADGFVPLYFDNRLRFQDADPLVLAAGATADADFRLLRGRRIEGHVFFDADGDGLQGAGEPDVPNVEIQIASLGSAFNFWSFTDTSGDYAVPGLPASFGGSPVLYRVSAHAAGTPYASEYFRRVGGVPLGTFRTSLAEPVDLSAGDATGVDLSLVLGGSITGTLTEDGSGAPLAALQVDATPFDGDGLTETAWESAGDGTYRIDGLAPGAYRVRVSDPAGAYVGEYWNDRIFFADANPVSVAARATPDDPLATTADFALARGGAIEGVVYHDLDGDGALDAGEPLVEGASVSVSEFASPNRCCFGSGNRRSGLDGRYRVGGLPPGLGLRVQVSPPFGSSFVRVYFDGPAGGDRGSPVFADAVAVTVPAGGTTGGIHFALELGGTIEGLAYHDLDGDGALDAGEPPLAGASLTVSLFAPPNTCCFGNSSSSAADGRFRVTGVPAGSYRAQINPPSGTDFIRVYYDGAPGGDLGTTSSANAAAVSVASGAVATTDFALLLGGSISGFVRDGNGVAMANRFVNASAITAGLGGTGASTNASGQYVLRGLGPGQYRVNASGGGGAPLEYWNNQPDSLSATPVTVAAGATTGGIDFHMGTVPALVAGPSPATGARGTTVTGIQVEASGLAGPSCTANPPPCSRVELGGAGLALANPSLSGGVFTFDLTIAADAALGSRVLTIVNDFTAEDTAATVLDAFEVTAGGTPPAPGGQRLYVSNVDTSQVLAFGTADNAAAGPPLESCCDPGGLALSADGSHLYVTGGDRALGVIDTRLGQEVARTPALGALGANAVALGARYVYTVNREFLSNNRIQVTDGKTWLPATPPEIVLGPLNTASPFSLRVDPTRRWLYVAHNTGVSVIDVDPASPALHTVVASLAFPSGFGPRGVAFTPDGSRAYVTGTSGTYVIDTAEAVRPQPNLAFVDVDGNPATGFAIPAPSAQAGISPLSVRNNQGHIEIAPLPGTATAFAYIPEFSGLRIVDVSTAPDRPVLVRTVPVGFSTANVLRTTADGALVYVGFGDKKTLAVLDMRGVPYDAPTRTILTPSLPFTRFARDLGPAAAFLAGGAAAGPVPGAPPASAPVVTAIAVDGGAPARNGAPISVTLSGANFSTDPANPPIVWLQGTLVRGTADLGTLAATSLRVTFPAATPTGDHRVVVTNPKDSGNESGVGAGVLAVRAPLAFAPQQNVYVSDLGKDTLTVYQPDGERAAVLNRAAITIGPSPAGVALTPDGSGALVSQVYSGPYASADSFFPTHDQELACVELDPASPRFRQAVGHLPHVWGAFDSPAMVRDAADPDGVFAYVVNRGLGDTLSIVDPGACSEVDRDDDPSTQTYADRDEWGELVDELPGLSRLELDGNIADFNVAAFDAALSPDGTLLYVAQGGLLVGSPTRPAFPPSLGVVDAVARTVLGRLTFDGDRSDGDLRSVGHVAVSSSGASVYMLGTDSRVDASGLSTPYLFVYRGGTTADTEAALDARFSLEAAGGDPATRKELPRGLTLSADGGTVYTVTRARGELLAIDVAAGSPTRGLVNRVAVPGGRGLFQHALAAEDGLLYVTNVFGAVVYVFDVSVPMNPALVTTFGARSCPGDVAVQPTSLRPRVTGVSPTSGPVEGGTPVTITGARFAPGAAVHFAGAAAAAVTLVDSRTISATTPPGANGLADVRVTNPDAQSAVLAGRFRYQADPNPPVFTSAPHKVDGSEVFSGPPGLETVSLRVRWTTDEPSTSRVDFGTTDSLGTTVSDPALVLVHEVTLSGLAPGAAYRFRATSVDSAVPANAASYPAGPATSGFVTPAAPDVTPPVITSGPTVSVTSDSALVQWTTSEDATGRVRYDDFIDGNPVTEVAGGVGRNHSVTLPGLAAATLHEYRVLSADGAGNLRQSGLSTFRTAPLPDATPPALTGGPSLSYLSNDLVIVTWTTSEPSTSFVNYGAYVGPTCNIDEQGVIDVSLVTTHVVFLTNLLPGTRYAFQVGSTDPSGNSFVTADPCPGGSGLGPGTYRLGEDRRLGVAELRADTSLVVTAAVPEFETPPAPDTTAPTLTSAVSVQVVSSDRVLVTAGTDEAASLLARFRTGEAWQEAFEPAFTRTPALLLTGLAPDSTYELEVVLTDPKGNAATVGGLGFVTPAAPDGVGPVIAALTAGALEPHAAVVTWTTDEPASSLVRFGPQGSALVDQSGLLGLRTAHSVTLSGLRPGTTYEFQAVSQDGAGNPSQQTGTPFTTAFLPPEVSSVTPGRGAPGATLDVVITGERFDADAGLSGGADLTVNQRTVNPGGTHIAANITVAGDAAFGPHALRVTNPRSGLFDEAAFVVVDAQPPAITVIEPTAGSEIGSRVVTVRGTVSEASTVEVNGVAAIVSGTGPVSFEATVTLPNAGANSIVVRAVDASGNEATAVVDVAVVIAFQVAGGTITEGNDGTVSAVFTVTLEQPAQTPLGVAFATADGSATAGLDYQPESGVLAFQPGDSAKTVTVSVLGDVLDEDDETFSLDVEGRVATFTIRDDDAPVRLLRIRNAAVTEGHAGTTDAVFELRLSGPSGRVVQIAYATENGTGRATPGVDYVPTAGMVTFAPGSVSREIRVPVIGDVLDERREGFYVVLQPPVNALARDRRAHGVIVDDDPSE